MFTNEPRLLCSELHACPNSKRSMTHPPELQAGLRISVCSSVSLPFCPPAAPWWQLGSVRLKEISQLLSQPRLMLEISVAASFPVQWKRAELATWTQGSSCQDGCRFTLKHLRSCSSPTNVHPPTVRENQARPFVRWLQQGQDLPRDPSPLERPCLPESLDPPTVKSIRHTDWISWIPTL